MRNLHTREAKNNSSWEEQSNTAAHEKNKATKTGNKKYSLLVRGFHIFKPVPLIWYKNKREKFVEWVVYIYYIILY